MERTRDANIRLLRYSLEASGRGSDPAGACRARLRPARRRGGGTSSRAGGITPLIDLMIGPGTGFVSAAMFGPAGAPPLVLLSLPPPRNSPTGLLIILDFLASHSAHRAQADADIIYIIRHISPERISL